MINSTMPLDGPEFVSWLAGNFLLIVVVVAAFVALICILILVVIHWEEFFP